MFLRYIASVLPPLGETSVVQTTVESLVAVAVRSRPKGPAEVARIKGDSRMAGVLRTAVRRRITVPTEAVEVTGPRGLGASGHRADERRQGLPRW